MFQRRVLGWTLWVARSHNSVLMFTTLSVESDLLTLGSVASVLQHALSALPHFLPLGVLCGTQLRDPAELMGRLPS